MWPYDLYTSNSVVAPKKPTQKKKKKIKKQQQIYELCTNVNIVLLINFSTWFTKSV
jgi:hypothetical protein